MSSQHYQAPAATPANNPYGTTRLLINDSPQPKSFDLSTGSYRHLDGTPITSPLVVSAYYSVVVVCIDTVAASVKNVSSSIPVSSPRLTGNSGRLLEFSWRLSVPSKVRVDLFSLNGRLLATAGGMIQTQGLQTVRINTPVSGALLWRVMMDGDHFHTSYCGKAIIASGR